MVKFFFILLIKFYKVCISPLVPNTCRFNPSCSTYTLKAIEHYGALKGGYMSIKRIIRCNPFFPGGYDPID